MTINHLTYLTLSVLITVGVAATLHRHGRPFLVDVFAGNGRVADAVNAMLVVGFYLVNVGLAFAALKFGGVASDLDSSIEVLGTKIGRVLLILGGMHFFNIFVFTCLRRRTLAAPMEIVDFIDE